MWKIAKILAASAAFAATEQATGAEKTMTFTVENMTCASCPYIVRQSLASVPGVRKAEVSYERKTAVVIFENTQASIADLMRAAADSGFPISPTDEGTPEK